MLTYQPKPNTIIMCNFDGFISPEMVKNRPVIVLTKNKDNPKLVTIVPISTTEPHEITDLHVEIVGPLDGEKAWVKCDMVTTVCLERLDRLRIKVGQRYKWETKSLDNDTFQEVKKSVANYLGFNHNNEVPGRGLEDSLV
ncbi:type II toxin-antitoxin system PemK/MazF family toxin [Acinetobacter lwoffii]|uniref:type II toxin-antitoxin system PemK/MazF family toxin n=1 Tax=Acinetobacter lwoffii TaxID=28090 RepID=UPI00168CAD1F|nr:type II toxin-antitoxin system PemK/MazF family toxin [Acinetobacter lwoffii]